MFWPTWGSSIWTRLCTSGPFWCYRLQARWKVFDISGHCLGQRIHKQSWSSWSWGLPVPFQQNGLIGLGMSQLSPARVFQPSRNFAELLLAEQRYFKGMKDMGFSVSHVSTYCVPAGCVVLKQWWRHATAGSLHPRNTSVLRTLSMQRTCPWCWHRLLNANSSMKRCHGARGLDFKWSCPPSLFCPFFGSTDIKWFLSRAL